MKFSRIQAPLQNLDILTKKEIGVTAYVGGVVEDGKLASCAPVYKCEPNTKIHVNNTRENKYPVSH